MTVRKFRANLLVCAITAGIITAPLLSRAAPVPWREGMVVYTSKGKPLAQVLKDVLATQPFPVVIKSDVRGDVYGEFDKPARAVFSELEAAYGFTWYYDGSTMYISSSADSTSQVVAIAPLSGAQALRALSDLGLIEPRFNLRVSGGSVLVSGPSRYVELVVQALDSERDRASLALNQRSMSLVGALAKPPVGGGSPNMEVRVFPLRYAQAQDSQRHLNSNTTGGAYVVPGVATLLRNLLKGAYATPPPDKNALLQGLAAGNALAALAPPPGQENDGSDLRTQALLAFIAAQQQQRGGNPQEGLIDREVHIQADVRTNSVVIFDTPAMMTIYRQLIEQLDRPQNLVQLDVAIIDIDSGDVRDLGVDLSLRGDNSGISTGANGLNFQALGGSSMNKLRARVALLETQGRARVLSRPKIMTLDNMEAYMGNDQTYYVKTTGDHYANLTPITSGLSFRATPLIIPVENAPAKIKLSLEIDDGGFVDNNVDGVPGSNHKYLSTQAVVEDGQSLLVGGFQYENVGSDTSGVPGLKNVPGVGALFRRTRKSRQQIERLFLITPRVVNSQLNDTPTMQVMLPRQAAPVVAQARKSPVASISSDNPQFLNIWASPTRSIDTAPPAVLPVKPLPPVPHSEDDKDGEKKASDAQTAAKSAPATKAGSKAKAPAVKKSAPKEKPPTQATAEKNAPDIAGGAKR